MADFKIFNFFLALVISLWGVLAGGVAPSADHPQGELWLLLEQGKKTEANSLELHLTDILQSSSIRKTSFVGLGISGAHFVQFDNNIFAVLKTSDPDFPESYLREVAAYKLDRLLGLNMVPLTVLRDIQGQTHSLQLYYPRDIDYDRGETRKRSDLAPRIPDLAIFDFIVGNEDRVPVIERNAIVGKDGRLVAIDHGRAFTDAQAQLYLPNLEKISLEFRDALAQVTQIEVVESLRGLLAPENITQAWENILLVQKTLVLLKNESSPFVTPTAIEKAKLEYVKPVDFKSRQFDELLHSVSAPQCQGIFSE